MNKQLAMAGLASFVLGGALLAAPSAMAADRAVSSTTASVAADATQAGLRLGGGCHKRKCKCKCKHSKHHKHYHKHYHEHYHKHHHKHDHGHHHGHHHHHKGHHHKGHHHKYDDDYYDDHYDHYDHDRTTSGDVIAPVVGATHN
ncbi:hypothetical protein [Thermomonospora catenispora]|uniref:hypothetical protein n=1 Tax=Thermomonospora catenispora TaxID=2493090 RepID=UPI0013754B05|nr:hypothetical protein [Thermomonospora catenispora]